MLHDDDKQLVALIIRGKQVAELRFDPKRLAISPLLPDWDHGRNFVKWMDFRFLPMLRLRLHLQLNPHSEGEGGRVDSEWITFPCPWCPHVAVDIGDAGHHIMKAHGTPVES